jgi:hypothetical protein
MNDTQTEQQPQIIRSYDSGSVAKGEPAVSTTWAVYQDGIAVLLDSEFAPAGEFPNGVVLERRPNGDWVTQLRRAVQRKWLEWFDEEFADHVVLLNRTEGALTGHAVTGIIIDDGLDGGAQ